MRCHPTIIERLNAKHRGLEKDVCDWMRDFVSGAEISKRLLTKYKERVCVRTVNTYRKIRWQREQEGIKERKKHYTAIAEVVGEKGLDAGAAAQLWEALQSMTPKELLAMRRLQLDREQVKILDKRAENQMQRLKAKLEQAKGPGQIGAEGGADADQPPNALEIRRRIREIYGLPDDTAGHEDYPVTAEESFRETVDAVYGIGKYNDQRSESEPNAFTPLPDHPSRSGPETSDPGVSSDESAAPDGPSEGGAAPAAPRHEES